jgi:homoserine kinase
MKGKVTLQTRLYLGGAITLLLGLGSSAIIYLTAVDVADGGLGSEVAESKMYRHDLELYGGKANVLAAEFMNWFGGLWHGQPLAYTVGWITIFIAFGLFFVAYHTPSDPKN